MKNKKIIELNKKIYVEDSYGDSPKLDIIFQLWQVTLRCIRGRLNKLGNPFRLENCIFQVFGVIVRRVGLFGRGIRRGYEIRVYRNVLESRIVQEEKVLVGAGILWT